MRSIASLAHQDLTPVERIPFNDLAYQWRLIRDSARPDIERLFETSAFCLGPFVDEFEEAVARFLGVKHAVGVNSGTSALHLAMIAAGVGPGDAVLVPSHTFVATVWAVLYVGATPILCDVEPESGNIDLGDAERRIRPEVKAIVPVHLYGQPANMSAVEAFARKHDLVVVEDAAQAIGARYGGQAVGTLGFAGCFSFYPGKNLGAAGESGLIVTNDDAAAARMRSLRNHGQSRRYVHEEIGFNYRMEGVQAIVLRHKLQLLPDWIQERKSLARAFDDGLSELPLTLPKVVHEDHVYHLYVIRTKQRDALRAHFDAHQVETGLHYPVPLHRQPCLSQLTRGSNDLPIADAFANECLTLPLFVGMRLQQVERVCAVARDFFKRG